MRIVIVARVDPQDPATEKVAMFEMKPEEMDLPMIEICKLFLWPAFVAIRAEMREKSLAL